MLELINKFSKNAEFKLNIQKKSIVLLYTSNKLSEREIKRTVSFIIASKNKILGTNLTKEVIDLYSEKYRALMKKNGIKYK